MSASPDIQARLTAFGFGLTQSATFSGQVGGSIYQWATTNFPAFQTVDVCLASGGGCAGGGSAGLGQGQSSPETYSIVISGPFTNGVTITPIPAKFQTGLGSLETDGVVVDPPPSGASDLTIAKTHTPSVAIPGQTVTYTVTVTNVGSGPSSGTVTVTETPPAGLTITALSGTGWTTCTVSTGICTRSDALAAGMSYPPITVVTSVGAGAAAGTVTNTAVVSGGGDSNSTNNTATDPTVIATPAPGMDLTIRKRHSPQTVVAGEVFTYFITVLNVGSGPSSGAVTVTETPPAGLTVTALSGPDWICTVATRTCTRSDALAPAASYPDITVTTSVGAGVAPGTVINTAVVSGGGDPNNGNNTATDPTDITSPVGGPDLALTKTPSASVAVPGQTVTFTIKVMNVGDAPTSGTVTVTEAPPPSLTVTALSGTGWTCVVATRTCLRGDALSANGSYPDITVTAVVAAGTSGTIVNGAAVSGGGDTNPGNNTGVSPIEVVPAAPGSDLTVAKTRTDSGILLPGQPVTFAVRVTNVGGSPTSGTVTVTETPPSGLTVTALSGSGWTCNVSALTCTRADVLAASASYPDITVTANIAVSAAGTLVNSVAVSGGGDSNAGNNTATSPITITPPPAGPDLTLTKTQSAGVIVPGQTLTFTIRTMNVGGSPTSGTVTVTETPPTGLTITALSGPGWTCSVATRTCTRADALGPSASYPDITVTAVVAAGTLGTIVNGAAVSGGGDTNGGDNTATDPITVTPPAAGTDLTIAKTRTGSGSLLPGQPVTFTLTTTNVGSSPTSGTVTVTETPPSGLTVTALSGSGWSCSVATRTCTRADALAPSASYPDITVTANIAIGAVGTLVNSSAVSGGGDSNAGNNNATSSITVGAPPVPTLPVVFMIALMSALLGIALLALRARRSPSL
jgi:uncharacterized repeat protein (TIGR01451 family)